MAQAQPSSLASFSSPKTQLSPKGLNGGITEGVAVRDLYHKPSEFPQQDASIVELIKLIMIRIWTKNPK